MVACSKGVALQAFVLVAQCLASGQSQEAMGAAFGGAGVGALVPEAGGGVQGGSVAMGSPMGSNDWKSRVRGAFGTARADQEVRAAFSVDRTLKESELASSQAFNPQNPPPAMAGQANLLGEPQSLLQQPLAGVFPSGAAAFPPNAPTAAAPTPGLAPQGEQPQQGQLVPQGGALIPQEGGGVGVPQWPAQEGAQDQAGAAQAQQGQKGLLGQFGAGQQPLVGEGQGQGVQGGMQQQQQQQSLQAQDHQQQQQQQLPPPPQDLQQQQQLEQRPAPPPEPSFIAAAAPVPAVDPGLQPTGQPAQALPQEGQQTQGQPPQVLQEQQGGALPLPPPEPQGAAPQAQQGEQQRGEVLPRGDLLGVAAPQALQGGVAPLSAGDAQAQGAAPPQVPNWKLSQIRFS